MPSFDIVSEISGHEIRNAVENANRELTNRWDFRNVQAAIEFNEKNESIKVSSESDFQVEQLIDILRNACIKRNIESNSLDIPADYEHNGKTYSKEIKLKQGIETDMALASAESLVGLISSRSPSCLICALGLIAWVRVPSGPLTVMLSAASLTSAPLGTAIGIFPIRDMFWPP